MKAEMREDGTVVIKPESGVEAFALAHACAHDGPKTLFDLGEYPGAAAVMWREQQRAQPCP